eukprot:c31170_g1_i1 orf=45-227(+)
MPRSQRNDNFIDKTFTILADILLQILPTTKREREASTYYRDGAIRKKKLLHIIGMVRFEK